MRSFNEAGAVMPRKWAGTAAFGTWDRASMRPGLLCPGSTRFEIAPRSRISLQ